MSWISLMENIIQEDQQKIMGAVGSEVVQMYLQKYKVRKSFFFFFSSKEKNMELVILYTMKDTKFISCLY